MPARYGWNRHTGAPTLVATPEVPTVFQLTALYHPPADPAGFNRYYDDVHVGLALKLPGLQRYTATHPAPDPEGNPPAYQLVAVLEWADEDAFKQSVTSPEGQEVLADLPKFADAGVTLLAGPAAQYL